MHELSTAESILNIIKKEAQNSENGKVTRISLKVGKLTSLIPECLETAFQAVSQGTIAENAMLEIEEIEAQGHCRSCGADFEIDTLLGVCEKCGSPEVTITGGDATEENRKGGGVYLFADATASISRCDIVSNTAASSGGAVGRGGGLYADGGVLTLSDSTVRENVGHLVYQGWGHSTWRMACDTARQANAGQLVLTHHNAMHDDDSLDRLEEETQAEMAEAVLAREGMILKLLG